MNPEIVITGNLGDDPELRYSPAGNPFTRLSVAHTDRFKDGDGKWQDGDTFWWNVTVFGSLSENVAESLHKGDRVIVAGRVTPNEWKDKEGENRRSVRIIADSVGPDLRWATANIHRVSKEDGRKGPTDRKASDMADEWDRKTDKKESYGPDEAPF